MVKPRIQKQLFRVAITLMILVEQVIAVSLWQKVLTNGGPIKSKALTTTETDLAWLMTTPMPVHSLVYSQALELLTSLESAPNCMRQATSNLLTTCQTLEVPQSSSETAIEDVRSMYAAQLAICEIEGAGAPIPANCQFNVPASLSSDHAFLKKGSKQLERCLGTLESRPQWWTSYSNNKQNAILLCQAARVGIDKEELLELHKKAARTSSDIESALSESLQEANRRISAHRLFASAVETYQKQLVQDLDQSRRDTQSYFESFMEKIGSTTKDLLKRISTAAGIVEADITGMGRILQNTNAEALHLRENIGKVLEKAAQEASNLAKTQTRSFESAVQLHSSLEAIRSQRIDAIHGALEDIQDQLRATSELMFIIHDRQNTIDVRFADLDHALGRAESRAESFHALQTIQATSQAELFEQLKESLQLSLHGLSTIDTHTEQISSNLQEFVFILRQLADIGLVFGTLYYWGWLAALAFTISWFSKRAAFYTVLLTLVSYFTRTLYLSHYSSIRMTIANIHHGNNSPVFNIIQLAVGFGLIATIIVFLRRVRAKTLIGLPKDGESKAEEEVSTSSRPRTLWDRSMPVLFSKPVDCSSC